MGGRISGESPREEKVSIKNGRAISWRPFHTIDTRGDPRTAAIAGQASWQQLTVWAPLGQHESSAWDALVAEVAQCEDIGAEISAKATSDPWRVTASSKINAMS
jgi:hypothetical protein